MQSEEPDYQGMGMRNVGLVRPEVRFDEQDKMILPGIEYLDDAARERFFPAEDMGEVVVLSVSHGKRSVLCGLRSLVGNAAVARTH